MLIASGLFALLVGAAFAVLLSSVADLRARERRARQSEEVLEVANVLERQVVDLDPTRQARVRRIAELTRSSLRDYSIPLIARRPAVPVELDVDVPARLPSRSRWRPTTSSPRPWPTRPSTPMPRGPG